MVYRRPNRHLAAVTACVSLGVIAACQSAAQPVPATLHAGDDGALTALKATLAEAIGKATVDLGPSDPVTSSVLTVRPPPLGGLEGRSPVVPIAFDLMTDGEHCFVVRRETGMRYPLGNVACRAL